MSDPKLPDELWAMTDDLEPDDMPDDDDDQSPRQGLVFMVQTNEMEARVHAQECGGKAVLVGIDPGCLAKAQVDVADLVRINAELSRRAQTAERERDAFAMLAASVIEGKGLHEDKVNRLMEPVEGWVPDIARIRRLAGLEEA